jgi:hypothetical protein
MQSLMEITVHDANLFEPDLAIFLPTTRPGCIFAGALWPWPSQFACKGLIVPFDGARSQKAR